MKLNILAPHDNKIFNNDGNHETITSDQIPEVADSAYLEINISDLLDYAQDRESALKIIVGKLRHNGVINIEGMDLLEVARNLYLGNIDVGEANLLLYKDKLSSDTILNIETKLQNLKCEIVRKRIDNNTYSISAKRL